MSKELLILNIDKIHTTKLGVERIKRNLKLNVDDVVDWCKKQIQNPESIITKEGKNWYVNIDDFEITINSYSYTIITAHKEKHIRLQEKSVNNYSKEELKDALRTINSIISKCEKIQPKLKEGSTQSSLMGNRLKALCISASLITDAIKK